MPRKAKEEEIMEAKPETGVEDLRDAMKNVAIKLCSDLMDGKARNEDVALKAIVDIYEAIK